MARVLRPAQSLRITHEDPLLVMEDDWGRKKRLYTDNRGTSFSVNANINPEVMTAGWEGSDLVVETTSDKNGRIIHHYQLEQGGSRLSVNTEIEGQKTGKTTTLKMLYDRSSDSSYSVN
ncbi:hypothetical protein CCP4SC76_3110002 [Gammaproteobacteria bacterium]